MSYYTRRMNIRSKKLMVVNKRINGFESNLASFTLT